MSEIQYRRATQADVAHLVALYADDPLGREREDLGDLKPYFSAFAVMNGNPDCHLIVAEQDDRIIGTYQLNIAQSLAIRGQCRATLEAVRIVAALRGQGLGAQMVKDAARRARVLGADILQLTSHASRKDAHRFYEKLGFQRSHAGFKMRL
jgi:GNAT superfamily N-acetyltransferase